MWARSHVINPAQHNQMKIKFYPPRENIAEVIEMLWNKGLIIAGAILGVVNHPFYFFLMVPSLLYDLRIED